jgi:CheY-like chemotaxis protein
VLATGTRGTLLVAEDNEINQLVVRRMLEKLGYESDLARNGREAVDKHTGARYAAILMDCEMPELNGYDATREIRSLEDKGHRTPVIAMTAHTSRQSLELCLDAGMDDHIAKPLRSETLKAVLDRALAGPQPRRSSGADAATAT